MMCSFWTTLTLQGSHLRMFQTHQSCMIRGEMTTMILHLLRVLHLLLFLHRPFVVISLLGRDPLTRQQALQVLHAHHLLLHLTSCSCALCTTFLCPISCTCTSLGP